MTSFGFITVRENQEVSYITEIAKRSLQNGIDIFRLTPHSIDPSTENVHGLKYNSSRQLWESSIFPIPDFLYDRCFYGSDDTSKKAQPIMNWLKSRPNTVFLGHGLPNKWHIYQALKQDSDLAFYLPHTEIATSSSKVFKKLVKEKELLLKPISGSMGNGIIGLYIKQNKIKTMSHYGKKTIENEFTSKHDFLEWLDDILKSTTYLYQPLLQLQDEDSHPFDIRILLQKNKNGKWQELGRGVRKGQQDYLISNISGGADIISFDSWLEKIPAKQRYLLLANVQSIISKLPGTLESHFQSMFEIGIDLGMAKDGSVWILDTNSKPGRKVVLASQPSSYDEIYSAPLHYCKFLAIQATDAKRS